MMQLPNGLFYELEDLPAQVQERAIQSFLEGHRKIIRAMIRQRRRDVQTMGLMWMIHCLNIATYEKMQKQAEIQLSDYMARHLPHHAIPAQVETGPRMVPEGHHQQCLHFYRRG